LDMVDGWKEMSIAECASKEPYSTQIGPFGSAIMAREYRDSGVPVIRGVNVNHGRFYDDDFVFVSEEKANQLSKYESFPGDVLLVHRGTLGKIGLMPSNRKYQRYILGNSMLRVHCDETKLLPEFLFYWLSSPYGQDYIFSRISQVGVPALPTPLATLRQAILAVPPIQEQHAIVRVLGNLDDKIELNGRINRTLDSIAKVVFKSWFVEFEFPNDVGEPYKSSGGEMSSEEGLPRGWQLARLADVADFTRGFSYSGFEKSDETGEFLFVTLNSVREGGGFKREFSYITTDRAKDRHFVHAGDIVIANTEQTKTGTLLGCPALVEFPHGYEKRKAIFSHHITKVIPKMANFKHYLFHYLLFRQPDAAQYNTGSVIWALDIVNWARTQKIPIPSAHLLECFEHLTEGIFQRSLANNFQAETLAQMRDTLLPKLISGKIRVPVEAS
jgi:type I restriction enzyme, S subunit